jgi:hypothetical protein
LTGAISAFIEHDEKTDRNGNPCFADDAGLVYRKLKDRSWSRARIPTSGTVSLKGWPAARI